MSFLELYLTQSMEVYQKSRPNSRLTPGFQQKFIVSITTSLVRRVIDLVVQSGTRANLASSQELKNQYQTKITSVSQ